MKEAAKPYRNQRVSRPRHRSQQHLLEVSIRASKAREQRVRKALGLIFKLILVGAVVTGVWIGTREGVQRFFWDNPALFLSDIRVDTDGTLTREQILATAAVREGENIFRTSLASAREALDHLPQVERVEIQRTLPNRLDIVITERQPIAWVLARGDVDPTASEKSFLADARGYVMKSRKMLPEYYHLPIISGVETENLVPGQKVTTFEVQSALELLRLNADSTRWQVRNIDVSKGYCLKVTDRNHAVVTFGLDRVEAQLSRLYRLLDHVQQSQQEIRTVNLLVERNTPVTFTGGQDSDPQSQDVPVESRSRPAQDSGAGAKPRTEVRPPSTPGTPARKTADNVSAAKSKDKASTPAAKKSSVDNLKKPFRM